MLSFSPFNILCLFSAAWRAHPSCRSERTTQPWESVDTFLSESAALNFQKECLNGCAELNVLGAAIHLSLLYKIPMRINGDCVEELLIFSDVNHHWVIEKPLPSVTVTANNTNNIK